MFEQQARCKLRNENDVEFAEDTRQAVLVYGSRDIRAISEFLTEIGADSEDIAGLEENRREALEEAVQTLREAENSITPLDCNNNGTDGDPGDFPSADSAIGLRLIWNWRYS